MVVRVRFGAMVGGRMMLKMRRRMQAMVRILGYTEMGRRSIIKSVVMMMVPWRRWGRNKHHHHRRSGRVRVRMVGNMVLVILHVAC